MIESDRYWPEFLRAIERTELERDERFAGFVQGPDDDELLRTFELSRGARLVGSLSTRY